MRAKAKSFRVGKVAAVLRGRVWYLTYSESGRRRPRVGPDRDQARQMAAQINGQLKVGGTAESPLERLVTDADRSAYDALVGAIGGHGIFSSALSG